MLDSTYKVASDPNSMRDQGLCRNAVYNIEPVLEPQSNNMDTFYSGKQEFLSSSLDFHPDKERIGWVKSQHGDRKIQGVLNYKNHDLYSYGGKSHISKAFGEANLDLNDAASENHHYYESVRGAEKEPRVYEKEYHEEVNDYTKNLSQGVFSPGLTRSQYIVNRREKEPHYRPSVEVPRTTNFSKTQAGQLYIAPRPKTGRHDLTMRQSHKIDDVRRQRGFQLTLARNRTVDRARETGGSSMFQFDPQRPNAVTRKPDRGVVDDFTR